MHTSPDYRRDYVLPSKWHDSCVVQCPLITCSFLLSLELIQISLLHLLWFLCLYPNFLPNSSPEVYSLLQFSQTYQAIQQFPGVLHLLNQCGLGVLKAWCTDLFWRFSLLQFLLESIFLSPASPDLFVGHFLTWVEHLMVTFLEG